jgi:hypothetical protein
LGGSPFDPFYVSHPLLETTRNVLADLESGRAKSFYDHRNVIGCNRAGLVYRLDCSGFIWWLLLESGLGGAYAEIEAFARRKAGQVFRRVYAMDFANFFRDLAENRESSSWWENVPGLEAARAGDVLIFTHPFRPPAPGWPSHIGIIEKIDLSVSGGWKVSLVHSNTTCIVRNGPAEGIGRSVDEIQKGGGLHAFLKNGVGNLRKMQVARLKEKRDDR